MAKRKRNVGDDDEDGSCACDSIVNHAKIVLFMKIWLFLSKFVYFTLLLNLKKIERHTFKSKIAMN